jgi:hypothetical protein
VWSAIICFHSPEHVLMFPLLQRERVPSQPWGVQNLSIIH